ncbi:MAG: hypothetical protein AAB380_04530 [Verrucomicrobiota bacterium]
MKLVTISKEFCVADADLKRSRLEAAGFHAFVNNVSVAGYLGTAIATGGVLLQVPESEAADAKEFLVSPAAPAE